MGQRRAQRAAAPHHAGKQSFSTAVYYFNERLISQVLMPWLMILYPNKHAILAALFHFLTVN